MRELKLQNGPNNYAGYDARRGEILASLGAIDGDIVTVIHRKGIRSSEYIRLDNRRWVLERQLIDLDEWAKEQGFVKEEV